LRLGWDDLQSGPEGFADDPALAAATIRDGFYGRLSGSPVHFCGRNAAGPFKSQRSALAACAAQVHIAEPAGV